MRAQKASATARVIAAATVFLHAHHREWRLVSDAAARWSDQFLCEANADSWLARAARSKVMWPLWRLLERATLPGIIAHYAKRKTTIERLVREALRGGDIRHLVVLGAGFDTLALRLSEEYPQLSVHEIDHPATQAAKRASMGAEDTRVRFTAHDLSVAPIAPWFATLSGRRIVVVEGLLMYFPADQVEALVRGALGDANNADHLCIFTYMEQNDNEPAGFRPRSRLIDTWLARKREPFLWSANATDLTALVARAGGRIEQHIDSASFDRGDMPAQRAVIRGENIVVVRSNA